MLALASALSFGAGLAVAAHSAKPGTGLPGGAGLARADDLGGVTVLELGAPPLVGFFSKAPDPAGPISNAPEREAAKPGLFGTGGLFGKAPDKGAAPDLLGKAPEKEVAPGGHAGWLGKSPEGKGESEPVVPVHITSTAWPCQPGEELFFGKCYVTCLTAAGLGFPKRADPCTCCKMLPCPPDLPLLSKNNCLALNVNAAGREPQGPSLTSCRLENEELFGGLCYLKCSLITYGRYAKRTGMNTCSNGAYGGDWTMGIGPCSGFGIGGDNCLPHIPAPEGVGYESGSPEQAGLPPLGIGAFQLPQSLGQTAQAGKAMVPVR